MSNAEQLLGFRASLDLEERLTRLAQWWRDKKRAVES
jgi:hypothetical protein